MRALGGGKWESVSGRHYHYITSLWGKIIILFVYSSVSLYVFRVAWNSSASFIRHLSPASPLCGQECCGWLCCLVLCGVASFSVTSLLQNERWTSCFGLVLPVSLACAAKTHGPALGLLSVTLTCLVDWETGPLYASGPTDSQTYQLLLSEFMCVCVLRLAFLCVAVCILSPYLPRCWDALEGTVWINKKKGQVTVYFAVCLRSPVPGPVSLAS